VSKKIIPKDLLERFDKFKAERHWLVHRSMIEINAIAPRASKPSSRIAKSPGSAGG